MNVLMCSKHNLFNAPKMVLVNCKMRSMCKACNPL